MKFYGCQKADEYNPTKSKIEGWWAEPKFDGYRLTATIRGGEVRFYSRGDLYQPYTRNLTHIGEQLLKMGFDECLVDGEIMATDWGATAAIRHVSPGPDVQKFLEEKVVFHVFDWVPVNFIVTRKIGRIDRQVYEQPFSFRRALLSRRVGPGTKNVRLAASKEMDTAEDVTAELATRLAEGYEGLVLKDPAAPYVFDRSAAWLKVKPTKTIDLRVTGVVEGTGKYVGMMGALACVREDGQAVFVGTGFVDAQRADYWNRREELTGKWLECKVQDSDVATARHPVFVRWRVDRDGSST